MKTFLSIIKYDYLQRTRSYSFLITLCISLAVAYTFVPEPNASYSTIRIGDYVGYYNAAWFGYVTAIMTSIFLSLVGFYLVNSGIKSDHTTKIGQITASTTVSNFKYLSSKVFSNFLLLITIVLIVFLMSIILFFLYNEGFSFEFSQFLIPYILIPIPAMFFIATISVVFEVVFRKHTVIQNIGFFFLFSAILATSGHHQYSNILDPFGSKIVIEQMEEQIKPILKKDTEIHLSIGYVLGNVEKVNKFNFDGVVFSSSFIVSRLIWVLVGLLFILGISTFFHRFNLKEQSSSNQRKRPESYQLKKRNTIILSSLPTLKSDFGIFSLVKTELMLLIRKGKQWLWILNVIGMVLLPIIAIDIVYVYVLPILWFMQVHRLSDIASKEVFHKVHYLAFSSYKPLSRLLTAQLISGVLLLLFLTSPLIIKLCVQLEIIAILHILLGAVLVITLATTLGILSKGKKLFEVLFFMITYANINQIPFVDYFGGSTHSKYYTMILFTLVSIFITISFIIRKHQLRNSSI